MGDDDADDADLFREALNRNGRNLQFQSAPTGLALLELLSITPPHQFPGLLFLDINMPVMNGWECLRKLKEIPAYRDIPVIVYSTSSLQRDITMAYDWGALLYITKPDNFKDLWKILDIIICTAPDQLFQALAEYDAVKRVPH